MQEHATFATGLIPQGRGQTSLALPEPRHAIRVRVAGQADLVFIDRLQKMHGHMVGFFPYKALLTLIGQQRISVAVDENDVQFGYILAKDAYMQQEQVGIVYQLNIVPLKHRHLIGATLLKDFYARSPYGMRLCCCWCAQDLPANHFWQAMGFIPLAFRCGSRAKQRTHIFWQARVRAGDVSTPWWFPSQTRNGAMREDRIILPILPGQDWRDAKPMVLPGVQPGSAGTPKLLANGLPVPGERPVQPREPRAVVTVRQQVAADKVKSKHLSGILPGHVRVMTTNGVRQFKRPDYDEAATVRKPPKQPKPKNEPAAIANARELRDRFLEIVNAQTVDALAKYDIRRTLPSAEIGSLPCLLETDQSEHVET